MTNRETFDNLATWLREVEMYASADHVKLVIGNKLDAAGELRGVSRDEGAAFARAVPGGALFMEASARSRVGVQEAFDEMVRRVLETPAILAAQSQKGMSLEAGAWRASSRLGCC